MKRIFIFFLLLFVVQFSFVQPAEAVVSFTLSEPTPAPPLSSGDTVSFDLLVNTGGESVTSQSIGMRYNTQYLSFTSFSPGSAFPTVTTTTPSNGDFLVNVSHPTGYTGSGVVGTATFQIIADTPGSTTLCSTFLPTPTPTTPGTTVAPTSPNQPTCIPVPAGGTSAQYPNPPYCPTTPTELPMSGNTSQIGLIGGAIFFITFIGFLVSKKKLNFLLLFFFVFSLFLSLSNRPVQAEELYRNYRIDISPIPCAGVGGCPNDFINNPNIWQNYPHDRGLTHECATSMEQFKSDPTRYHYWVEDPDITEQGKADERARQFLYWVLNTTAIDNHPTIRNIWFFSSTMAYVFVILVAAIFGIGYIISKRTNFALHIEIRPTLIKIGTMLLYIAFSYALLLFLIQLSEIMMKFFIDNLGGDRLFNIYFAGATSSEENYKTFVGCRDLNIRVQESANAEIFLLKLTNVSYYIMGTMILLRKILLWFLIFVSPFLAILMPFILIRNTGWIWIGVFFQWLFYGPLLALFLGATAQMWANGIPFAFDFSKVKQATGYIYPTAMIITYGGPAQIAAKQIGAFNNGNYVDTFAEYVITLIMLWAVTFFPWWLLRIFRDYCCEGIYATRNILLAIYDQLRAPPPGTGPKGPTMPKLKTEIKIPTATDTNVKVNVKLSSLEQIRQVNTNDISKTLNLNASKLTDIAKMEINRNTKQTVINNIKMLSNPMKAQTPTERQQYMNLRTELFTRAVKNDSVARTILASTSTSRVEQLKQREHILKEIPASTPIVRIVSAQTNLTAEKINNITQSYMQSVSKQNTVINNIAKTTNLPSSQVNNILTAYSQSMNQPMTNIIHHISTQTQTSPEKVKLVLQQAGAYTSQANIIHQTATKEKIKEENIGNILVALSNVVRGGPSIGQVISSQTNLSPEKTQSIIDNLFSTVYSDSPSLQFIENQSQVKQEQIKQVLSSYTENINQAPSRLVADIATKTALDKEKVVTVIQSATSLIQESELVKEIAKKNNYEVPTVLKVVENIQTIMASPSAPPINMPIIEKTAFMSKLTPIQVQSIATSVVKQVVTDSSLVQEISTNNAISPAQVTNILQSYITNISKPAGEVINTIASQNNISTNTVNTVLQETHEIIKQSKTVRNIARREQVSTKAVNTVAKVIFATSKDRVIESQSTPVNVIATNTTVPTEQAIPIITSVSNSFVNNSNAVQNVSTLTGIPIEQVKQTVITYARNINNPISTVINTIAKETQLSKDQTIHLINTFSTVANSSEVLTNVAQVTNTTERQVREVIAGIPASVVVSSDQSTTPLTFLTQTNQQSTQIQTADIVNSLTKNFTENNTALQTVSAQTGTPIEQVKQTITQFTNTLSEPTETIINTISNTTGLTSSQTTNIIKSFSTVMNSPEVVASIAKETNTTEKQVHDVVEGIPASITSITKQQTTPINILTQTTNTDSTQVMQVTNALAQYASQNSSVIQTIKNETSIAEDKINTVLASYNTNLNQDSETLITNISRDANISQSEVSQVINSYAKTITNDTTAIQQIANQTNTTENQVKDIVQTIPTTVFETVDEDKQPVVKVISYKSHIPEAKVQSVTNSIVSSIVNNTEVMENIQKETGLKAPQVTNVLTTYAQNVNQPTDIITERIYQSAGIEKSKVSAVLRSVTEHISSSKEIVSDVARKEGLKESDVASVISHQIPLATEPDNHIEQSIPIPATTSIEDYEEVKDMWVKQYEEGEVPVTENIQSRDEWVNQDIVFITNTLNKLLSPDEKLRQEGLDDLGYILPIFMINNLKGDELLVYLKAKLEAAKVVDKDLAKEQMIRAKVLDEQKAKDEELVELKRPKQKEKEMTFDDQEKELETPKEDEENDNPNEELPTEENTPIETFDQEKTEQEITEETPEAEESTNEDTTEAINENTQEAKIATPETNLEPNVPELTDKDDDLLANIKKKLEENSRDS